MDPVLNLAAAYNNVSRTPSVESGLLAGNISDDPKEDCVIIY